MQKYRSITKTYYTVKMAKTWDQFQIFTRHMLKGV